MFSERQRVVIIDDNYEEVRPLLFALWQKGISYIYLDGQIENLPEIPYSGVRLIFLDIVIGMENPSDKNKAAPIANVVSKIVGTNPGPYFIVFWTKHDGIIKEVIRYLQSVNISPVGYINLDKPTSSDDDITIDELIQRLEMKLSQLESFNYVLELEGFIEKAVTKFSSNFFSIVPPEGDNTEWSKRVRSVLGKLALAYTEKPELENNENDVRHAFLLLADSLNDSVQQIIKTETFDYKVALSKVALKPEQIAKINTSLFIDFNPDTNLVFGNIFFADHLIDIRLKEAILNDIKPRPDASNDINLVGMIITPACDLANKKYLHNDANCFRILYGLLIPVTKSIYEHRKEADFTTQPFWYPQKEKIYQLIFHFGSLTSIWWKNDEMPPFEFTIKEHLAFDIQSKMANHANRLGNSMIPFS
ncbi:MAG: hypothetical protein LBR10_00785 [Prevotellaceae bacterium]|jgi:hypothetical protein|nr:hypothetical protein [Prevotellaceae bacterium]